MKRIIASALLVAATVNSSAQDWNRFPGGDVINGTEYLGAAATSTVPLLLKTVPNLPIHFSTNNINRMRLSGDLTGMTVNGYGGLDLSGFLGVGDFAGPYAHPSARVHTDQNSTNAVGYRPMIGEGFLASRGESLYYGGLLNGVDAGIIWSRATGQQGPPGVFRFIYTGDNLTPTIASSASGLELGRFTPDASLNTGFFGLGDWFTAGLDPTERLHLLDGRARIEQLPTDPAANTLTKVMVVDDTPGAEFGVVKWRDASSIGGADCDWEVTANADVVTAHLASPPAGCPGQADNVGIGTTNPGAKLDILKMVNSGTPFDVGVNVRMGTTALTNIGGEAVVGTSNFNVGWRGNTRNGTRNWALDGNAAMNSLDSTVLWTGARVVGVRGFADGNFLTTTSNIRGVWGIGRRPHTGGWGYGGWFDGYTYCSLGVWGLSDLQLKDNVTPLSNAMDKLLQVQPMSFKYKASQFPTMGLDDATHFGVIAQDLEAIFPELVRDAEQPAAIDSLGNEVHPAVQFKTVNQDGLIPWMIAGMQEQHTTIQGQQATIEAQNARIDQLEDLMAACCAMGGSGDQRSMNGAAGATDVRHTDLFIIPNPVADLTQLRYTIATSGRTRLEVADGQGKRLEVLEEAVREVGTFEHTWNTQDLAPGTYHCTLYLNDTFVVKKVVKVAR